MTLVAKTKHDNDARRVDAPRINPDWRKLPLFDRSKWERVRFGDMVENINETCDPNEAALERFIAMEHLEPGSLRIRSWGNVADGTTFTRRCKPGHVLFGKRRAYQRKVAVTDFDAVVSGDIYVFASKNNRLLPELLPYLCVSERFFNFAVETSAGSLSPRTNWSYLANFEFGLPPLDQQRRIAEILWGVDKVANSYDILIGECSRSYSTTLFHLSVDNGKSSTGPLENFVEFITDGDHNPPKRCANGIPHLVVKHIESGKLNLDNCTYISQENFERMKKRYNPKPNDLILTCVGTIGRIALVPDNLIFSADRSLALVRFSSSKLMPEFAKELLESDVIQAQMASKAIGTAQKHLYLKDIRGLRITIPSVTAQQYILSRLEPIRQARRAVSSSLMAVKRMSSEITNSLFIPSDV